MALRSVMPTRITHIPRPILSSTTPTSPIPTVRSAASLLHQPPQQQQQQQQPPPSTPPSQRRLFSSTPPTRFLSSLLSSSLPQSPFSQRPPTKHLTASRTLPYPPSKVFPLISDVDSYSLFLPHCTSSRVRARTPAPHDLPSLADLTVGYGPLTQTYTSRVYCVPPSSSSPSPLQLGIVEAISGNASTSIPAKVLERYGYGSSYCYDDPTVANDNNDNNNNNRSKTTTDEGSSIFERLVTRWEVRPVRSPKNRGQVGARHVTTTTTTTTTTIKGTEAKNNNNINDGNNNNNKIIEQDQKEDDGLWSEVNLRVTFQFASPALGFAVGHVADMMVDEMVEAFEARARLLYGEGR